MVSHRPSASKKRPASEARAQWLRALADPEGSSPPATRDRKGKNKAVTNELLDDDKDERCASHASEAGNRLSRVLLPIPPSTMSGAREFGIHGGQIMTAGRDIIHQHFNENPSSPRGEESVVWQTHRKDIPPSTSRSPITESPSRSARDNAFGRPPTFSISLLWQTMLKGLKSSNTTIEDIMQSASTCFIDPATLMVPKDVETYTNLMLKFREGYPLYRTGPFRGVSEEYWKKGVRVGDVGRVGPDGAFDFLFNISEPRAGLPPSRTLQRISQFIKCTYFPPGERFLGDDVKQTGEGPNTYRFVGSEGAILELPEGATRIGAWNLEELRILAANHAQDWYAYMNVDKSMGAPNGSLYLVTDCIKCRSCGIATFCGPVTDNWLEFHLGGQHSPQAYRWRKFGPVFARVGQNEEDFEDNKEPRQCVFIRGFKITLGDAQWRSLTKIMVGEPSAQESSIGSSQGKEVDNSATSTDLIQGGNDVCGHSLSGSRTDSATLQELSSFRSPMHPSDFINTMLLQRNPDAKLAMTHDEQWCDSLPENFAVNPANIQVADLLRKVDESYIIVKDQYGSVSLERRSKPQSIMGVTEHGISVPMKGELTNGNGHPDRRGLGVWIDADSNGEYPRDIFPQADTPEHFLNGTAAIIDSPMAQDPTRPHIEPIHNSVRGHQSVLSRGESYHNPLPSVDDTAALSSALPNPPETSSTNISMHNLGIGHGSSRKNDDIKKTNKKEAERLQIEAEKERSKLSDKMHRERTQDVLQERNQMMATTLSIDIELLSSVEQQHEPLEPSDQVASGPIRQGDGTPGKNWKSTTLDSAAGPHGPQPKDYDMIVWDRERQTSDEHASGARRRDLDNVDSMSSSDIHSLEEQQPQPSQNPTKSLLPKQPITVLGIPSLSVQNDRLVWGNAQTSSTRSYTPVKILGDGAFGQVLLCDWHGILPPNTPLPLMQSPSRRPEWNGKRLVAVKRIKKEWKQGWQQGWDECQKNKELESLRNIPPHANVITLYDYFILPDTQELYFVCDAMEGNLFQLIKSRKGNKLAGGLVANIFYQVVSGLLHIHSSGYFHRDMKPENILVTTIGLYDYTSTSPASPGTHENDVVTVIKIADFGLAREIKSKPPYTDYVSVRWYRAPEIVMRCKEYSSAVDMWALGTIIAELVNLLPLFPGSDNPDQLNKIVYVLGNPSDEYGIDSYNLLVGGGPWPKGLKIARAGGYEFPKVRPKDFYTYFEKTVPISLINCIRALLRYDPEKRLTSKGCLEHTYLMETLTPENLPPDLRAKLNDHHGIPSRLTKLGGLSFGRENSKWLMFDVDKSLHNRLPPVDETAALSNALLKHPETSSTYTSMCDLGSSNGKNDDIEKMSKKEAKRLQMEAEKERRKLLAKMQREQARAIMQKRNQMMTKTVGNDIEIGRHRLPVKSKQATLGPIRQGHDTPGKNWTSATLDGAAGRASNLEWKTSDERMTKARRRDFDDDHSTSSSDVHSLGSLSSFSHLTVDSDPSPSRRRNRPSIYSFGSSTSFSSFSLDSQLAQGSGNPDLSPPPLRLLTLSPSVSSTPAPTKGLYPNQEKYSTHVHPHPEYDHQLQAPSSSGSTPKSSNSVINPMFKMPPLPSVDHLPPSTNAVPPFSELEAVADGESSPVSHMTFSPPSPKQS